MYIPVVLEVYNRLFIDCLGTLLVHNIKKHLFVLTQSNILTEKTVGRWGGGYFTEF